MEKANKHLVANLRTNIVTTQRMVRKEGKERLSKERIEELKKFLRDSSSSVKAPPAANELPPPPPPNAPPPTVEYTAVAAKCAVAECTVAATEYQAVGLW